MSALFICRLCETVKRVIERWCGKPHYPSQWWDDTVFQVDYWWQKCKLHCASYLLVCFFVLFFNSRFFPFLIKLPLSQPTCSHTFTFNPICPRPTGRCERMAMWCWATARLNHIEQWHPRWQKKNQHNKQNKHSNIPGTALLSGNLTVPWLHSTQCLCERNCEQPLEEQNALCTHVLSLTCR